MNGRKGQTGHDRIDAANAGLQFCESRLTGGLVLVCTRRRYENGGVHETKKAYVLFLAGFFLGPVASPRR